MSLWPAAPISLMVAAMASSSLGLAHLLGQELLDHGDLGRLLGGLLLAAGLLVDGERLAALLDHLLQQRR